MNPFRDTDWMAQRRMAFRDLTGQFYTDILDDVQVLIDRGQGAIRLATDGHSIRVFVRRASDYLIGGTYEVPSGLGGTFRVILKDACDRCCHVNLSAIGEGIALVGSSDVRSRFPDIKCLQPMEADG